MPPTRLSHQLRYSISAVFVPVVAGFVALIETLEYMRQKICWGYQEAVLGVVLVLVLLVEARLGLVVLLVGLSAVLAALQSVIKAPLPVGLLVVLVAEYQVGAKNQLDEGHY